MMADNDALTRPARSRCEAALSEAENRLADIVAMGSKTLMMAFADPQVQQAYSLGANRAFQQAADMARAALDRISTLRKAGE